jgi:hypothetical protein
MSALFGGASAAPAPPPPSPKIGDAVTEAAARENRYRLRKRRGSEDTILGSGVNTLGDSPSYGRGSRPAAGGGRQLRSTLGGG